MKYPNKEPFVIRTVYEDTYDTYLDYVMDTSLFESVGKVHTIWRKGKDPRKCPTCGNKIMEDKND